MKLTKLLTGSVLAIVMSFAVGAGLTRAQEFHSGDNVSIRQKSINQSVYSAGKTVDISTEVYGDIYCAGQTVTITGTIHGDVLCAGQTIHISGKVLGDVRLLAQTVTLNAQIAGNASIGGQTLLLDSSGSIGGDATIGSGTATINGKIGRDVLIGGETVTINAPVGRDVTAGITALSLGPDARIGGNVSYTSDKELVRAQDATIGGKVTRNDTPKPEKKSNQWSLLGFGLMWFLYIFVALQLVALFLALVAPGALRAVTDHAFPSPWKALLTGFVGALVAPAAIILTLVTVIGIPLGLLLLLTWVLIQILSGPFFGYYIGRRLMPASKRPVVIMLAGGALLIVTYFIPVIGFIAMLSASWTGSGMILQAAYARNKRLNGARPAKTTDADTKKGSDDGKK